MIPILVPARSNVRVRIPIKNNKPAPPDDIERIGVSMRTAAKMLELSERSMWVLVKEKKIRSIKCGARVIVSVQSLREFVDGKVQSQQTVDSE